MENIKKPFYKQPLIIAGSILAVCVIAFVTVWLLSNHKHMTPTVASTPSVTQKSSSQPSTNSPAAGTNNTSLNNDLNGIDSNVSKEGSDMNSADSSINDQQNQIVVPTN